MTFAWPQLLWLIALPLALFGWELRRRRVAANFSHAKILRAEAGRHSLRLAAPAVSAIAAAPRVRPWLWIAMIFAIAAVARPQWGRIDEPVFDQSREILIAIDLSRSMLAPDVKPSRLDRAKLLTQSLLEKLEGERVGLIVFSGTAFLQSPLSSDYEILRDFLPALDPGYLPQGGTNYRALIDTALQAFGATASADRFLIVLSDGEATEDDWQSRVATLKERGIRVLGLGIGSDAGAMIPDGSGGFVKDERGAVVLSKLESKTLRQLAADSSGAYRDASGWVDLASLLDETVETGRKGEFVEKNTVRLVERFQWPLALALWCFLVSVLYEFPVRPRPRDLQLARPVPPTGVTRAATSPVPALALALVIALTGANQARAADDTGPLLGKIYARVSKQETLSPQDYSEIAQETLRWGQRLRDSGEKVIPGPVHDAIEAVDRLKQINAKSANWDKLRADLAELLKDPDQPPPQDPKQKQDQENQEQQKKDQPESSQSKDPSQQDQQKQDQQKESESKDGSSEKSDQQKNSEQNPSGEKESKPESESAFGDMKDKAPPPPPAEETQKVGGVPEKQRQAQQSADPALAMPLQKLDQLRNQDSPAELFQLMEGDQKPTPAKNSKDW